LRDPGGRGDACQAPGGDVGGGELGLDAEKGERLLIAPGQRRAGVIVALRRSALDLAGRRQPGEAGQLAADQQAER